MLVTILLALFAVALSAKGGPVNNVNANCLPGKFFGTIEITLATSKSAVANGKAAGVYYENGDGATYGDAAFDATRCVGNGGEDESYCDSCVLGDTLKNAKILVVTGVDGADPEFTVKQSNLNITVTNIAGLTIKKVEIGAGTKADAPEESYDNINSLNIKYAQKFDGSEDLKDTCVCGSSIYCTYAQGDCYNFAYLDIDGVYFIKGDAETAVIHSQRAIPNLTFKNITFFDNTKMDIQLFPGIYQGGSEATHADYNGVEKLLFENVKLNPGSLDLLIEGNALDVQWNNVSSAAPFTYKTTARTTRNDIYCTVPGCTESAYGNMNLHKMTNTNLFLGSMIDVAGWVKKIETSKFQFSAAGPSPDQWEIRSKNTFEGCSRGYNVEAADFFGGGDVGTFGTTIDSDIHYSICNANFKNVSITNHIHSESDNVTVSDSVFNGHIRHPIAKSLTIDNASYNADTYYDHFEEASYNYYTATLNNIRIADIDFVLSVDNGSFTGDESEMIRLNSITCGHGLGNYSNTSKVFLLRHMSHKVDMNSVVGCNLYFKNTINNRHTTQQINLNLPQTFSYTSLVGTNTGNNYTFFDDAAYHVTTNIDIENNPVVGFIKFNRVNIDSQTAGGDIHAPEVDPLKRNGYGTSYPVNITVINNNIVNYLYVSNEDIEGMTDPTNDATGFCHHGGHGNNVKRDITYEARHAVHQNDDVNLTIQHNEIKTVKIVADSVKAHINELLTLEDFHIYTADSSTIRIHDSRFIVAGIESKEALELNIRHTVFDGNVGFIGGKSSLIDFRSVIIYNLDNTLNYRSAPAEVKVFVDSGYILFDHVKMEYGELDIENVQGDIKFVESFTAIAPTRVDLKSKFGGLTVVRPKDYCRDLNGVLNYEHSTGNTADFEYAKTDSFIYEPAPAMRTLTSNFRNIQPMIVSNYVRLSTDYGNIDWTFAENIKVDKVQTLDPATTLKLQNYDHVVVISSISAAANDVFFDFNIETIDFTKLHFISVHETSGAIVDISTTQRITTSNASNTWTCKRGDSTTTATTSDHDPFDICHGFIILPTIELTGAPDFTKLPTLEIDSVCVMMKDCSSSAVNSLTVTGAGRVFASELIAKTLTISLTYHMFGAHAWWRDSTVISIFGVTSGTTTINGVIDMSTDATISLNSNEVVGIYPTDVNVTHTGAATMTFNARSVIPTNGVDTITGCTVTGGNPYSECNGIPLNAAIKFDTKLAAATASQVNINLGSGGPNPTLLTVTHGVTRSLLALTGLADADVVISAGDNIIIDNHRFGTSYAASFNAGYLDFKTPTPTVNNVYVIPATSGKFSAMVLFDTNADGMLYNTNKFSAYEAYEATSTTTTHKFNLAEQACLYLYIPKLEDISITTAGDNINLFLGNIGTYGRIYTTSTLVANLLKAKVVETVNAAVYSLEGKGTFTTNYGYVGVNANNASAKILLETSGSGDLTTAVPQVLLESATMADISVYARKYKTITSCPVRMSNSTNVGCSSVVVPCTEAMCDIVNYIWEPTYKLFWVGKDFDKATKDNSSMFIRFNTNLDQLKNACPDDGRVYNSNRCPNTPIYMQDINFLSSVSVRGSPKLSPTFEPTANKNNRTVNPVNLGEVQVEGGMPGWAIGLIVITCVIAAVVLIMFILRLLGKESISDFGSTTVGALGPTN